MNNSEIFGERIYLLRTSIGLSQKKLGEALSLDRSTIAKYEHSQLPQVSVLIQIARYFEVSTDYLLGLPWGKTLNVDGLRDIDILSIQKFIRELRRK